MNHIYRSIWSKALGAWIAVSENSKSKRKCSGNGNKLLATGLLLCASNSWALPTGEQIVAGQATVNTPTANQMQINQASQKAVINWQGFSIAQQQAVNINQPNAQAALLNRVVGQDASQIQGKLNATGQVYIVNPNGVVFGKTAQVDVGGLIASTHNISNADFLNGTNHFTQNGATGTVENHGTINASNGGVVALIGEKVSNTGTINTPKGTTALAAGKTVDLDFQGDGLVEVKVSEAALNAQITNQGAIQADGGRVLLTAKAANQLIDTVINQQGIIRAQGLVERNGEIILDGGNNGTVQISGTLDATSTQTGGNIKVTGNTIQLRNTAKMDTSGDAGGGAIVVGDKLTTNQTTLQQGATAKAQARNRGTAGKIEILANMNNGTVNVDGELDASAPKQGDGGFIDTSAAYVKIADSAKISTKATSGKTGTWLIDPFDFTIAATGGNMTGAFLSTSLLSTSVNIDSINGNSGVNGDVNVNDVVNWSANLLTLSADRNININANLNGSGTAQLALHYGRATQFGSVSDDYFINNGAKINLPSGANFSIIKGWGGPTINYTVITSLGADGSMTGTDLQGMRGFTGQNYALGSNIDASAIANFIPVGSLGTQFTGYFAGLGHTINNLTVNRTANAPTSDYMGLFGYANGSIIRDVGLINANITGQNYVGGLVGFMAGGTNILNSYATGSVTGTDTVGGLVGYNDGGSINNAYATANVISSTGTPITLGAGGLVGFHNSGSISNAYATGNVAGTIKVGGLVGNYVSGSINNAYATGSVSGTSFIGGLVGLYNSGSITNAFWDTQTSGQATSAGGATGKTTAEMKQLATFTGWNIASTGGSSAVWRIYEGNTAPLLRFFLTPLTVSSDNISKTYNGLSDSTLSNPVYTNTTTTAVITPGANLLGTLNPYGMAINVGIYTAPITAIYSNQQGYDVLLGSIGVLNITPATLTYTANAASRLYGEANPIFSGTVTGFVNGETQATATTGVLDFSSTADNLSDVGSYAIDASGLTANFGNYNFFHAVSNSTALQILPPIDIVLVPPPAPFVPVEIIEVGSGVFVPFDSEQLLSQVTSLQTSATFQPVPTVFDESTNYSASKPSSNLLVNDSSNDFSSTASGNPSFLSVSKQEDDKKVVLPVLQVKNSAGKVKRLELSTNKQFLSLLMEDGSVRIWDFERGVQRTIVPENKAQVLTDISAVNDNGESLVIASKAGIGFHDVISSVTDKKSDIDEADINHIVTANDGSLLMMNVGANKLRLWDTKQSKDRWSLEHERGVVNSLAVTDDKRYGAVLSRQPNVYAMTENYKFKPLTDAVDIIDLATGKIVKALPNAGEDIVYMRFKDNDTLLVGLASGKLLNWSMKAGSTKLAGEFTETVVAVDNTSEAYAYVADNGTVRISNDQGQVHLSIQNQDNPIKEVKLLADGKKLLTVLASGDVALWDVATGKKLLRLFSTKQGWTVMDAFGRFDGSDEAMENFSWLAGEDEIPLDSFSENYYEPGLLASVMQNQDYLNSNPDMVADGITLPPKVDLQLAEQQGKADKVAVKLDVYDRGGGIDKVQIYQNNKLISNDSTIADQQSSQENNGEHRVLTLNVTPNAGKNTLKVVASNSMGIENSSSEISFDGKTKAYTSNVRLMTVGINDYQEKQLHLNYSVADAQLISDTLKKGSKLISSKSLMNENATKPQILAELKDLSQGTEQDVLVIYFAGHGVAVGKEWYFLPYETKLLPKVEDIVKAGVSATELSDIFKKSKIQHIMLMVDSCHSGGSMSAFSTLENGQRYFSRQLSRSLGITVVTAAAKDQEAAELRSLGHGLFTYQMAQEMANKENAKPITAHGIADSILKSLPALTKKISGRPQDPVVFTKGNDFMLTDLLEDKK